MRPSIVWLLHAALLAAFLLGSGASAQTFDLATPGARTLGMGGVNTATVNNLDAVFWNPAGLLEIPTFQVTHSSRWIDETRNQPGALKKPSDNFNGHHATGLIGFATPFQLLDHRMAAGITYVRPIELTTRYANHPVDGGVGAFTFGLTAQVHPSTRVGVAPSLWTGRRDFNSWLGSRQFVWETEYRGFDVLLGARTDLTELGVPYPVTVGASLRTPFTMKLDYDDHTAWASRDSASAFDYDVEMPWMLSLGAVWRYQPDWLFSLDYEARLFGDRKIIETGELYGERDFNLSGAEKSLHIFRIASEYQIEFGMNRIPVRIGLRNVPTLLADTDGGSKKQVHGFAFGLGTGIARKFFRLDLAYELKKYTREFQPNAEVSTPCEVDYSFNTFIFEATFFLGRAWK